MRLSKESIRHSSLYIVMIILIYSLFCWVVFADNICKYISQKIKIPVTMQSDLDKNEIKIEDGKENQVIIKNQNNTKNIIDRGISRVDNLYNDSICFRKELCKIDSITTYIMSREVVSEQVVMGKDNWMFYSGLTGGGDPLADYEGTNILSEREMEITAHNEMIIQKALKAKGIKFALLIAPNKESVYYDYYSDKYLHASKSKADILSDYMFNQGINVIWPKEKMISCNLDKNLYYKYDSHWNLLGAYIGVHEVLNSWDIDIPELEDRRIGISKCNPKKDLANVSGLTALLNDDVEYNIGNIDWKSNELKQIENEQLITYSHVGNESAKENAKLILVGDSFRINMIPVLSSCFSDIYIVDRTNYSVGLLEALKPDYFISEHVERQLYKLNEDGILIE